MSKYFEDYVYHLIITNRTTHDLALTSRQLVHGMWYRDGIERGEPRGVPAQKTAAAMGIRAVDIKKGYECRCTWSLGGDGDGSAIGTISLFLRIPFAAGNNKAGLDVSGECKTAGWTGVSVIGHAFRHELVVTGV